MRNVGNILLMVLLMSSGAIAQDSVHEIDLKDFSTEMVRIPAGIYIPFFQEKGQSDTIKVHAFYMDIYPVSNVEFLAFVKANPEWSRSNVTGIYADKNYLKHWDSDFKIGDKSIMNSPVTNVSWFAAQAYAKWRGKRLPTIAEWEYVAAAEPVNAGQEQKLTSIILKWYERPTPDRLPEVGSTFKNELGVYDMHGLIWEWVYDFNSIIKSSDSRGIGVSNNGFYCAAGALKAIDKTDYATFMRYALRESLQAAYTIQNLGFRCIKDVQ